MTLSKPPPYLLATLLSLPALLATLVAAHYSKGTAVVTLPKETAIQAGGIAMTLILGLSVWVVSLIYVDYKGKKDYRRARIQAWRDAISTMSGEGEFRRSVTYSEVRPYLSEKTLKNLDSDSIHIYVNNRHNVVVPIKLVLNDISDLERRWGLI